MSDLYDWHPVSIINPETGVVHVISALDISHECESERDELREGWHCRECWRFLAADENLTALGNNGGEDANG